VTGFCGLTVLFAKPTYYLVKINSILLVFCVSGIAKATYDRVKINSILLALCLSDITNAEFLGIKINPCACTLFSWSCLCNSNFFLGFFALFFSDA
jgi:hypothetical protein